MNNLLRCNQDQGSSAFQYKFINYDTDWFTEMLQIAKDTCYKPHKSEKAGDNFEILEL